MAAARYSKFQSDLDALTTEQQEVRDQIRDSFATEGEKIVIDYNNNLSAIGEVYQKGTAEYDKYSKRASQLRDKDLAKLRVTNSAEIDQIRESLLSREDAVRASYERQRQIIRAETSGSVKDREKLLSDLNDKEKEALLELNELAQTVGQSFANGLEEAILSGGKFRDILGGIADDILKILVQQNVSRPFANAISTLAGGLFAPSGVGIHAPGGAPVSNAGPVQLYAQGGIANTPQTAVFGEGSMAEAFVPLPDGRTIPVSMKGNASGGDNHVTVNVINETGGEVETRETQTGNKRMITVLVKQAVNKLAANGGLDAAMGNYGGRRDGGVVRG